MKRVYPLPIPCKEAFERLQEVIKSSRVDTAEALMNEVITSVDEFAGGAPQHDDITVIVVNVSK